MEAMPLVSMIISELKKKALERLKQARTVNEKDIRFVVTVPAIWDDGAKQFMREASEKVIFIGKIRKREISRGRAFKRDLVRDI